MMDRQWADQPGLPFEAAFDERPSRVITKSELTCCHLLAIFQSNAVTSAPATNQDQPGPEETGETTIL